MAEAVLEKNEYLSKFSESFKDDLVKIMISFDVPEGHIFVEEGGPIHSFYVVQSGLLIRTKRRYGEGHEDDQPILIDEVGPGIVTGFLHVAGHDDDVAFATIAAGKGGATVWAVDGSQFRIMCEENPQVSEMADWRCNQEHSSLFLFSLFYRILIVTTGLKHASEVIKILTLRLRSTTKIIRAILEQKSGGLVDSSKRVLRVLCYDTTSWVKENFEPKVCIQNSCHIFLFFLNYTNVMDFFEQVISFNESREDIVLQMNYTQDRLSETTARFAAGYDAVCLFVNDTADAGALSVLSMCGVRRNILVSDTKVL